MEEPLLELVDVSVRLGERTALDSVTLTLKRGRHVAVLGPNGAGKTTLLRLLVRELYPVVRPGMSLRLLGRERWQVDTLRREIGFVSPHLQRRYQRATPVRDVVLSGFVGSIGLHPHHSFDAAQRAAAGSALERLGAAALASRRMDELSTGEQRRALLARALVHEPHTLVLDEPTASLDLAASFALLSTLRDLARAGTTLVVVTHALEEVLPEIEHLVLLRSGCLFAAGSRREVLRDQVLSELYGVPLRLIEGGGFVRAVPAP